MVVTHLFEQALASQTVTASYENTFAIGFLGFRGNLRLRGRFTLRRLVSAEQATVVMGIDAIKCDRCQLGS